MIQKRQLGKTKLQISEIGLGCWPIGGFSSINGIPITYGELDESLSKKIILTALEIGVNVFDTADVYSLGNSEKILGQSLKDFRSEIHLFTKGGFVPSTNLPRPFELDLSYNHLSASLDRSLKRLDTDYVDLFQAHSAPQSDKDFENLEKSFTNMKREGKAIYCGVSIGADYEKGIQLIESGLVDSLQLYFSLINFESITKLFPIAKRYGVGLIIAEPLDQGFLSGKYSVNHIFPKTDERSKYTKTEISKKIEFVNKFKILTNKDHSLSQLSLSYILSKEEVSTCIPGAKSILQLCSNCASSSIHLTENELVEIEKIQQTHSMI
jgi:aryl-alcohol dehydrogenase-like predicted oxidoreductase